MRIRVSGLGSILLAAAYAFACGSGSDDTAGGTGAKKGSGGAGTGAQGGASGNAGAAGSAAAGAGGTAAGGTGAGGTGFGGFGADAGLPDVTFTYDGPVDDDSGAVGDACAASTAKAEPKPLDVFVMLDKTGSMAPDCTVGQNTNSKWCHAINALYQFCSAPTSVGTGLALNFFSGSACANFGTPAVPLAILPANLAAIQTALNNAVPTGNTPTYSAAQGIASYTAANQQPGRKMIGILITDGDPTSCLQGGNADTTATAVNTVLKNLLTASGIPTFVIGMTGATFSRLETMANNAGAPQHTQYCDPSVSPCHYYNVANGDPAVFVAVLKSIQQTAISCQYNMPTSDAGIVDPSKVQVQWTPGSGPPPQTIGHVADATQCGASGGWYYDNNANPTTILLCQATCDAVKTDTAGQIDILLGCLGS